MKLQVNLSPEGARAYRAMQISRAAYPLYLTRTWLATHRRPETFNNGVNIQHKTFLDEIQHVVSKLEAKVNYLRNLPAEFYLTLEAELDSEAMPRCRETVAKFIGFRPSKYYLIKSFTLS